MRRLSVWIVSLLVVAIVTGCGGAHRYDQRLIAADSLMLSAPDSALALLTPICGDSLPSDGDRAYRALLLTQARYKCYEKITADDDSAITRAMDYYRTHDGEREKLTRAYLYKGAVMEELAHVDSAMLYYKTAEANMEPDDYFDLAYVNLRMGALYRDHFSIDGKDIEKYEIAYHYLEKTDEKNYQLRCKINLGSLLRLNDPKRSESLLKEAMLLANEMNDTANYQASIMNLLILYEHYGKYQKSRRLIQHALSYPQERFGYFFFTSSAQVYAALGMKDSSAYFLKLVESRPINGPLEELSHFGCLSKLSLAQGDTLNHLRYAQQCKRITDSLKSNQETIDIIKIEHQFDQAAKITTEREHKKIVSSLIGGATLVVLFLSFIFYRRTHRYDHIIADFKQQSASQLNDLSVLKQNIDKLQIQDDQLKSFISNHLNMMREMIEACYHSPRSALSRDIRRIVEFQNDNNDSWEKLYGYMDIKYNNIMTETRRNYPQLNSRELLLLALTCLGCSCAQIAIISGYANATTISGNRQRLAKKMGLNGSVKQYTERFINSAE